MINSTIFTPLQALTKYPYFTGEKLRRLNELLAESVVERNDEGNSYIRVNWGETLSQRQKEELWISAFGRGWPTVTINNDGRELLFFLP